MWWLPTTLTIMIRFGWLSKLKQPWQGSLHSDMASHHLRKKKKSFLCPCIRHFFASLDFDALGMSQIWSHEIEVRNPSWSRAYLHSNSHRLLCIPLLRLNDWEFLLVQFHPIPVLKANELQKWFCKLCDVLLQHQFDSIPPQSFNPRRCDWHIALLTPYNTGPSEKRAATSVQNDTCEIWHFFNSESHQKGYPYCEYWKNSMCPSIPTPIGIKAFGSHCGRHDLHAFPCRWHPEGSTNPKEMERNVVYTSLRKFPAPDHQHSPSFWHLWLWHWSLFFYAIPRAES